MKVGIVMPTWRQGDHISDALLGIATQHMQDFHLVVVADGEPDEKTKQASKHPRIDTYIELEQNTGTANALNIGFSAALAHAPEYLSWVSSDNIMLEDWLLLLVKTLDLRPECGACYSSYVRQTGDICEGEWVVGKSRTNIPSPKKGGILAHGCSYYGPSFLYRASLHHDHRGKISHDADWWLRMEEKTQIGFVDELLCIYRVHDKRATRVLAHQFDGDHWHEEARRRRSR